MQSRGIIEALERAIGSSIFYLTSVATSQGACMVKPSPNKVDSCIEIANHWEALSDRGVDFPVLRGNYLSVLSPLSQKPACPFQIYLTSHFRTELLSRLGLGNQMGSTTDDLLVHQKIKVWWTTRQLGCEVKVGFRKITHLKDQTAFNEVAL